MMKLRVKKTRKPQAGISLIELMTVVGIVFLLSSMVVEQLNVAKIRASRVERDTIIRAADAAFTSYEFEFGDAILANYAGTNGNTIWSWEQGSHSNGDKCPAELNGGNMDAGVPPAARSFVFFPVSVQECLKLRHAMAFSYFKIPNGTEFFIQSYSGYSGAVEAGMPPIPVSACSSATNCMDQYTWVQGQGKGVQNRDLLLLLK